MSNNKSESGQMIIFVIIFSAVLLVLISSLVDYAAIQSRSHRSAVAREQALSIAEAGIEKAIWKLNNQIGYGGETGATFANGTYDITVTNLSGSSRLIRAEAYVPNSTNPRAKRVVQVTATIGTTNVGFNYGVQVGNGGLELTNSARIVGNVYANGNIIGTNSASIDGTAIAAGPTAIIEGIDIANNSWSHTLEGSTVGGNATHAVIDSSDITGNVTTDSMSNCSVGGSATYDTRFACSVSGSTTTPNPTIFAPPDIIPLPVSDAQIDQWESDATAGGTLGTQNFVTGTRNLGPVKIVGDLLLSNDAQVVVTGTIWVTGTIRLSNTAIMRLHPSYGSLSGVVLAGIDGDANAGYIEVGNFSQALGSGTAGSYIMLLSQKTGFGSNAIRNSNNGTAAILYAGDGMIEINNFASMKEITAAKLRVTNNAVVTYETGLANANFSSGPGGGWEIADQTWQLIQ